MRRFFIFVGARPNLMKAAPLCAELDIHNIPYTLYHSGQHYDANLSLDFEKQFNLKPVQMKCGISQNPIINIQEIISRAKEILIEEQHSIRGVIVFGDVITTYAVALATKQLGFPLVHVEAGLRSFDISMPEELIRIGVDHMSDMLFCPSEDAIENLKNEHKYHHVYMVGNIMIDCLKKNLDHIKKHKFSDKINFNPSKEFVLATFHRPENIDNDENLNEILNQLMNIADLGTDVIFPAHPRTMNKIKSRNLYDKLVSNCIKIIEPLGYYDFIGLMMKSKAVFTDSGGVQEESTYLGIPCFTVRRNTERPITIMQGTNRLVRHKNIFTSFLDLKKDGIKTYPKPDLWDGRTSMRIVNELCKLI